MVFFLYSRTRQKIKQRSPTQRVREAIATLRAAAAWKVQWVRTLWIALRLVAACAQGPLHSHNNSSSPSCTSCLCLPAHAKHEHTVTSGCVDASMRIGLVHAAGTHAMEQQQQQQQQQQQGQLEVAVQRPGQQQVLRRFAAAPGAVACSDVKSELQQEFGPGSLRGGDEVVLLATAQLQPGNAYVYKVFPGMGESGKAAYHVDLACPLLACTVGAAACNRPVCIWHATICCRVWHALMLLSSYSPCAAHAWHLDGHLCLS